MGSLSKQLEKLKRRKAFKEARKMYLDERELQERFASDGTPYDTNLIGSNIKMFKNAWLKKYDAPQQEQELISDEKIDLDWEE